LNDRRKSSAGTSFSENRRISSQIVMPTKRLSWYHSLHLGDILTGTFLGPRLHHVCTNLGPSSGAVDQSASLPLKKTQPAQAAAQETQQPPDPQPKAEAKEPPTPPHTGIRALAHDLIEDVKHLPAKQNLYLTLIGGSLAASVHPMDQDFNVRLRSHYNTVNAAFAPGRYVGNTPEQVAASIGTYAFGRLFDKPKVAHLGMDLVQAQILSELLVEPIKFATHRTRPDNSDRRSFPSGHAAVTFATATVIERHLDGERACWIHDCVARRGVATAR
jgi:hypothetical protein